MCGHNPGIQRRRRRRKKGRKEGVYLPEKTIKLWTGFQKLRSPEKRVGFKQNSNDTREEAEGYKQMNACLDKFANAHETILNEQTRFGGVYNRMEMSSSTLETTNENLTSYITDLNSVDYASAITQWMNAQYAYQASMQVASASMNLSLLNYM